MMNETGPTDAQLISVAEDELLEDEVIVPIVLADQYLPQGELADQYLLQGSRENYLSVGAPLYEAAIRCDWKAAKAIFDKKPELVRCSLTENGETALHVSASLKESRKQADFVKNLVRLMERRDLELQNKDLKTALYLAAESGNFKTVRILVHKSPVLIIIHGGEELMPPLYGAAVFGHREVVKFLYGCSKGLRDDGWNPVNRGQLLEKCVEADMFDIALRITRERWELTENVSLLANLARKPHAFLEKKTNIIVRSILSVFALTGITVKAFEKETDALQLLRIIWQLILKRPKDDIDEILKGLHQVKKQTLDSTEHHLDTLDVEAQSMMEAPAKVIKQDTESPFGKLDDQAAQLQKLISEHLMEVTTQSEIKQDNKQVSGHERDLALELQKLISKHIVSMHNEAQNIIKQVYGKRDHSQRLKELMDERITKTPAFSTSKEALVSPVLFTAAEKGNTVFLVELIRPYPDLICWVNDKRQSIFHIAVKHRHEGVYNLIYETGSMKNFITHLTDVDGNNLLHLAGKIAKKERLEDVSGAALKMQKELLWFKEVRNMVPASYREQKNKDGLTPDELFTEEHKELITEGEKWMKETSSQCMVVAALIATIVFAAAFTIPGGYNQNDGIPIFYQKPLFVVFVVADAISLFLSSTSILTFLSILTSRYAERDFVESLPKKLMLGVLTLFLSITTMMVTFSVSFFILYEKEMKWIPLLVGAFAFMPVLLYVVLQHHLLVDVIRSTYGSKYLFKPEKQFLYYVKPSW